MLSMAYMNLHFSIISITLFWGDILLFTLFVLAEHFFADLNQPIIRFFEILSPFWYYFLMDPKYTIFSYFLSHSLYCAWFKQHLPYHTVSLLNDHHTILLLNFTIKFRDALCRSRTDNGRIISYRNNTFLRYVGQRYVYSNWNKK